MNSIARHLVGLLRRSKLATFLSDLYTEARRLRLNPRNAADGAHLSGTWNFDNPVEYKWHHHLLEVLFIVTGKESWGEVLEIGCSEGIFTAELARLCAVVNACDISPIALERAKKRCAVFKNVQFICLNAAEEDIRGKYDIIFVMDVLWFVVGKQRRSKIIPNVMQCLSNGGLLVFSDSRMPKLFRHAIWSVFFCAGADRWAKCISATPGLRIVHRESYPPKGQSIPGWWEKLFVVYRKEPLC